MKYLARLRHGFGAGVIGLALTLGVVGLGAVPAQASTAGSPAPTTTAAVKGKGIQLSLDQVTPTSLTAKDKLVVSGVARNPGNQGVKNLTVALRFGYNALSGQDGVTDWVDNGDVATTYVTLDEVKLKNVPAHGTTPFTLKVEPGGMGLSSYASSFGPRPISLVATSSKDKQLDVLRSTVV